ncbi:unnamed protein product [Cunninghamella blakesleeana]
MENETRRRELKNSLYADLYKELYQLDNNIQQLSKNIKVTSKQLPSLNNLGTLHTALQISASRILNETNVMDINGVNNNNNNSSNQS